MRSIVIKSLFIGTVAGFLFTGCANDDDYGTPAQDCVETGLTANIPVAQLKSLATVAPHQYAASVPGTPDDYLEAYVTSSDERGAFFKVVTLQTKPTDGTEPVGLSVAIDGNGLFGKGFVPGRKVFIKLNGLYYANEYDALKVGGLFQETGEDDAVGRLAANVYAKNIIVGCTKVDEEELVKHMTITEALADENINRLIELDSVQFNEASFPYALYDETANTTDYDALPLTIGGATNHALEDKYGHIIIFRTSSYANFSGTKVAHGSGSVRGVLTKYRDDYQFVARYEEDIKLDQERLTHVEPQPGTGDPQGGTAITYTGAFSENFESYAVGAMAFPKYVNDYTVGERYWAIKQFPTGTGNKYIEMTSFNGAGNPGVVAKTYFIVPVDFTAANTFKFDKEIRYMAGQCLKVYYATAAQYTALGAINPANFTDITASFTGLTYPATGASQNSFTTAGTYNIPASLTGNGFFVFEYTGTTAITTTVQLDNITVN